MGMFLKLFSALAAIASLVGYFMLAGILTTEGRIGAFALVLFFGLAAIMLPGSKRPAQRRPPARRPQASRAAAASLPAPVTSDDEPSGEDLAEQKLARAAGAQVEVEDDEEEADDEVEAVGVHVSEPVVIRQDPEALEEADIERHVDERREHHARVRERIEARRRKQLAEVRGATAAMWERSEQREDLLSVLAVPGHGLEVTDEPEEVEPGHPYGAVFVRVDEARLIKLRIPLDVGFQSFVDVQEDDDEEDEDDALRAPSLPQIDGLPAPPSPEDLGLPAPPSPEDLGLELPPPPPPDFFQTGGQAKLAALRDELDED